MLAQLNVRGRTFLAADMVQLKEAVSAAGSSNCSGFIYFLLYRRKFAGLLFDAGDGAEAGSELWCDEEPWLGYFP